MSCLISSVVCVGCRLKFVRSLKRCFRDMFMPHLLLLVPIRVGMRSYAFRSGLDSVWLQVSKTVRFIGAYTVLSLF